MVSQVRGGGVSQGGGGSWDRWWMLILVGNAGFEAGLDAGFDVDFTAD